MYGKKRKKRSRRDVVLGKKCNTVKKYIFLNNMKGLLNLFLPVFATPSERDINKQDL